MALGLYFASHWMLVIIAVLVVAALGALGFFLKNWKMIVAAIVVAIFGFMYQGAVTSGIKLQMEKDAAAQVELLQGRIDTLNTIAASHALRLKADDEYTDGLEDQASETPKNDTLCLDAAAASRVRAIGGKPKPVAASPGRPASLFSKRSR